MVNRNNVIAGRKIDRHPLEGEQPLGVYLKGATVIAGQAQISGVIQTPEGEMTFQPGDYIVTDNPPTHAWPVRQMVFDQTYEMYEPIPFGEEAPRGPEPTPDYVPNLSTPPADVVQIKAAEMAKESDEPMADPVQQLDATVDVQPGGPEVTQEPPVSAEAKPKAKPKGGRIADSSSLPFAGQEPPKGRGA